MALHPILRRSCVGSGRSLGARFKNRPVESVHSSPFLGVSQGSHLDGNRRVRGGRVAWQPPVEGVPSPWLPELSLPELHGDVGFSRRGAGGRISTGRRLSPGSLTLNLEPPVRQAVFYIPEP